MRRSVRQALLFGKWKGSGIRQILGQQQLRIRGRRHSLCRRAPPEHMDAHSVKDRAKEAYGQALATVQKAQTPLDADASFFALQEDMDMSTVQEKAASKPFVESEISGVRADIAERFGELKSALADIKSDNAEQANKQLRTIITALILMTAVLGLLMAFLPQPEPPIYPPVIVHSPPASPATDTATPVADAPAPLPVESE